MAGIGLGGVPGDEHRPVAVVGQAEEREGAFLHRAFDRAGLRLPLHDLGRVDDDRLNGPVPVEVEPEDEEGGLGGDDRADLVGEGEAMSRLPPLLGDKRLHELAEPLPFGVVEEGPVGHAGFDDLDPVVGEGCRGPASEESHLG